MADRQGLVPDHGAGVCRACAARRAAFSAGTIGSAAPESSSTGLPARSAVGGPPAAPSPAAGRHRRAPPGAAAAGPRRCWRRWRSPPPPAPAARRSRAPRPRSRRARACGARGRPRRTRPPPGGGRSAACRSPAPCRAATAAPSRVPPPGPPAAGRPRRRRCRAAAASAAGPARCRARSDARRTAMRRSWLDLRRSSRSPAAPPRSRCGARSRNRGSFSAWPSEATGSSAAKPGSSVAISNRMPPGSRK